MYRFIKKIYFGEKVNIGSTLVANLEITLVLNLGSALVKNEKNNF